MYLFININYKIKRHFFYVTMNSLFSSTLDTVAPLRLRKIKENSPTPWYNEHTRTLKRAARKMERKLEENETRGISFSLAGK